jgi:hypothetical protein
MFDKTLINIARTLLSLGYQIKALRCPPLFGYIEFGSGSTSHVLTLKNGKHGRREGMFYKLYYSEEGSDFEKPFKDIGNVLLEEGFAPNGAALSRHLKNLDALGTIAWFPKRPKEEV